MMLKEDSEGRDVKAMVAVDRERIKNTFAEYVSHYDSTDGKIKLKIEHTYRVATLCERIAKSIGLSSEDVDIAWATGMLHDVGRFEQLRRYGTFVDADSIDHAHYGVQILFEEGKIHDYFPRVVLEKNNYSVLGQSELANIIRIAIWNHSAYRVEEGISKRLRMFCDILRDADKIDILKVNHDVPLEVIYNINTQDLLDETVTTEVMKQFFERHAILRSTKRTSVDNIVGHVALVFELVYKESVRIVREQGYLDKLLHFESENPITQQQFKNLRRCMEEFLTNAE